MGLDVSREPIRWKLRREGTYCSENNSRNSTSCPLASCTLCRARLMGLAGGSKSLGRRGPASRTRTGRPSLALAAAAVLVVVLAVSFPLPPPPFPRLKVTVDSVDLSVSSFLFGSGVALDKPPSAAFDSLFFNDSFLTRFSRTATFGTSLPPDGPVGFGVDRDSGFNGDRTAGVWSSSARARFCGREDGGLGGAEGAGEADDREAAAPGGGVGDVPTTACEGKEEEEEEE